MKRTVTLILTLCLLCPLLGCVALAEEKPLYLALGDSISAGYGLGDPEKEGFVFLAADALGMEAANHAVSGYTTADVLRQLREGRLDDTVEKASLITLTMGGNDLLHVFYGEVAAAYGKETGDTVTTEDIQGSLAGNGKELDLFVLLGCASKVLEDFAETESFACALKAYEENLTAVVSYLRERNPYCHIVVCSQYNPYESFVGTFYQGVYEGFETGILKLNASIAKLGKEQGFYVAAVYDAFVKAEGNLCNADASDLLAPQLDFHPNKKGHALLAETVAALAGSLPEPKPPAGDSSLLFWFALPLCLAGAVWKLAGMRVGKIV